MLAGFTGAASLAMWSYLLYFRAGFWRMEEASLRDSETRANAKIVVLIPARNEAPVIGQAVQSLLQQIYRGIVKIVIIDDNSSDGTRDLALQAAHALHRGHDLQVLSASPPPVGWTGKLWALSEGLRSVSSSEADYFLFADADIAHSPENLAQLVARAESANFDLVSLMVKLRCQSLPERSLIPAFLFFFFMLYPPAWVSRTDRRTAAAAGGCILIRPAVLADIGGISAIRGELIDDCALAKRVKEAGGRIFLGPTTRTHSLREYRSWCDIEQMIARTAFTQLDHSLALLIGTLFAMMIVFIAPPLLLFLGGLPFILGAASWLLMSICFSPTLRLYKISRLRAPTLPAVALFYLAATVHSAVSYWLGRGGAWKGRLQDSPAAERSA